MTLMIHAIVVAVSAWSATAAGAQTKPVPNNPAIDMQGFLTVSREAANARDSRRISEADFIRMSREPGTSFSMRGAVKNSTNCTSRGQRI